MLNTNVIYRTFPIRCGESCGTAFSFTRDGRQYLVTAAHIVSGWQGVLAIGRGGRVAGLTDNLDVDDRYVEVKLRFFGTSRATDVAIFDLPEFLHLDGIPLEARTGGVVLGQRVSWLGYPLGLDGGSTFQEGGRIGLAASGTFASMHYPSKLQESTFAANSKFIVDGMNNPGYSGSPVVCFPGEDRSKEIQVLGVISGTLAAGTNWGLISVGNLELAVKEILSKAEPNRRV